MSNRYACIITDDDGREVVSAIGQFEGAPQGRGGRFEPVTAGVRIGMVRGGPVDAAGAFGFPLAGAGAGAAVSMIRAALKALGDAGAAKPDATAKAKPDVARRKPKAKPARGKRAKSRRKPVRKAAKPAAPAGIAGQV